MSKMRSYLKPPLPKSPIRLRSRQVLHSSLQTPSPGFLKPGRRLSDVDLNPKPQIKYSSISSEIHALAKMVKDEFAEEEDRKKSSNLESLAKNSVPLFERGRFYEEYSAKRNERLRRKKGEEAVEGGVVKGTPYNLGVNHEPMTNKRRGTAKKESIKKTVVSMVESSSIPRYSLRSMAKENRKPPLPLNVAVSAMKSVTTRKGRRI
ncbi:hypothetical protein AT5G42330 [Arabidopsis thaliana]|uniref:At5g42330 n=1 Tax=Arabidopsis thaliana TaxID=3702 RepID=Q6GKX1_ARATH|nr:uncharacterized protein AT5G42330 [Arabidopsis thaliana]AAT47794.1 At5g42330 [Arabidopsis thaliana]AAU05516.1 At5g42330 [Arabidopsis thaliana]AED94797.1 hypothetical protein AT5G42330 [Arabidopsis thaliana]BAD44091.1 unknown protein [Arabidopsis thaliana]|eukprot:NP_199048.2 hypothetical protein AT5G42330 [Arabidopsis thaliana]